MTALHLPLWTYKFSEHSYHSVKKLNYLILSGTMEKSSVDSLVKSSISNHASS